MTHPVIDMHHHMFAPALIAALHADGVDEAGGEPVPAWWTPEQSLRMMDRYGIDVAILSVPIPLLFADVAERARVARAVNEFGSECARRWPDRFGFFATLPLPDVDASIAELGYALDAGADGVGLLTNHGGVYQGDPALDSLYAALDGTGAVAFVHPAVANGGTMPTGNAGSPLSGVQPALLEFPFETTRAVANLIVNGTLERFGRIRFVVSHCGGCVASVPHRLIDRRPIVAEYAEAVRRGKVPSIARIETMMRDAQRVTIERLARLHYDIALSTDEHVLRALLDLVPASQLVLGTDFPMGQEIGVHVTLDGLEQFDCLTDDERAAVRSTNAVRLLPRFSSRVCVP